MTRRLTFDLDLAQARAVLRHVGLAGEPLTVTRLPGGNVEVYRLDMADGADPLVLKIYDDEQVWAPAKEQVVGALVRAHTDVPAPEYLALDETRAVLPYCFAVMTLLPGSSLRHWFEAPDVDDAYRQVGDMIRRLHRTPMPAYGYLRAEGLDDPMPTNALSMAGRASRTFERFRDKGGDPLLAEALERLVAANAWVFNHSRGPVLCHEDLHPGNILAERGEDGALRLTGLIDFVNARAADPVSDLAKALFCSAHEHARSRAPILEGYGPIDHPDPERALWVYTLLNRASMWAWLTSWGRPADDPQGPGGLLADLRAMVADPI